MRIIEFLGSFFRAFEFINTQLQHHLHANGININYGNISKDCLIENSIAKNSVEVYLNNGTTKSRCSEYSCTRSFHQLHNCSQESTLIKNESKKIHVPGLRRYLSPIKRAY